MQGIHQQVSIQNDLNGMPTTLACVVTQQCKQLAKQVLVQDAWSWGLE